MSKITFLGDIYMPDKYQSLVNYQNIVFNLEYAYIDDELLPVPGKINLGVKRNYIDSIFNNDVLSVCMANNHVFDYGDAGLTNTLENIKKYNIGYFGVGLKGGKTSFAGIIDGISYTLLGYCCKSTNPFVPENSKYSLNIIDVDRIERDIVLAKKNGAERVIVSMHWGDEEVPTPKPNDVNIARKIIDFGADLLIGHHAHRQQSYEIYKDKYIFYGLGNCIFPDFKAGRNYVKENGSYTGEYIKKQKSWNKKSYAVQYDLKNQTALVDELIFDGKNLKCIKKNTKAKYLSRSEITSRAYKKVKRRAIFHNSILNYIANPKLLGPSKIMSFMKSMKSI